MLDAIAPGAAVFEPEEVDVLTAACGLAIRKIDRATRDDPEVRDKVAKLIHNLGRSRLRHHKKLKDAADAASLAEEAADLLGYLRDAPDLHVASESATPSRRQVPFFPANVRLPPTSILRPRTPEAPQSAIVAGTTTNSNATSTTASARSRTKPASAGRTAPSSRSKKTR